MPFPPSDRVIYAKNPLIEVICQIRFPTVLRISTESPTEFQERIRQEYPLYALQEPSIDVPALPKEVAALVGGMLKLPTLSALPTHRFSSRDRQRSISLSQDFVALTELRYTRWEDFRTQMKGSVDALEAVYHPAFYTRVGLRYKDLISRRGLGLDEARWAELLKSHMLGELGATEVADEVSGVMTQSTIRLGDIPGAHVKLNHGLVKRRGSDEDCYLIDSDFAMEAPEGVDEPFAILDRFNRLAGCLFRWAITDKLHRAMEPVPI